MEIIKHRSIKELIHYRNNCKSGKEALRITAIIMIQEDHVSNREASRRLKVSPQSVCNWVHLYNENGIEGLIDKRIHNKNGGIKKTENILNELDKAISTKKPEEGGLWNGEKVQN